MKNGGKGIPLVYLIILTYNGMRHLPVCLSSVKKLIYGNLKVLIVDNGSADGSAAYARENFPEFEVLRLEKNCGFSAANNRGMELAMGRGADYIALLNDDTEVDPRWITELVERAEGDRGIGACASMMLYFSNRDIIQSAGVCLNRGGIAWDYLNGRYLCAGPPVADEVIGACGGAFFARVAALEKAGGLLDKVFRHYMEDLELCMRIWDAGFRVVTVPGARVYHKYSATLGTDERVKNYYTYRSRIRLVLKSFPARMAAAALRHLFLWHVRAALDRLGERKPAAVLTQLRALLGAAAQLPDTLASRLSRGPIRCPEVWRLVSPDPRPPTIRLPSEPSAGWENASDPAVVPGSGHRPPAQLGPGWYTMWDEGDYSCRWLAREASLSLRRPSDGSLSLTLTVRNDHHRLGEVPLAVSVDGEEVGTVTPGPGENTYRLPVPPSGAASSVIRLRAAGLYRAELTHEPTDLSFKIKEIGFI